jgi:hypothetical protein
MLRFLKGFFGKVRPPENTAPYKIDPPVPLTPPVVDMSVFPHLTVDGHGDVHETKKPVAKKPAASKAPAKPAAKTPRTSAAKPPAKTPAVKKPSPRKPSAK